MSGQKRYSRSSARRLDEELNGFRFSCPMVGYVKRSPAVDHRCFDATPARFRQAFTARGLEPTKAHADERY